MLEGLKTTVYESDAAHAARLETVGGSINVVAGETPLTVTKGNQYGYLTYLRADCFVAGTTAGSWYLRCEVAGAAVLLLGMGLPAAPAGSSYCWPFPVPWKTTSRGGRFTIEPSVGTMGTWAFFCNGFYSSI